MSEHEGRNGKAEPPADGSTLWAWVGEEKGETGVARLRTAWIPLGTINLVAFSREVMAHPNLLAALQEQADKDGQTVRLFKFVRAEEVVLEVRPRKQT